MDQVKPLISIQCPEHKSQLIGTLDIDCNAKKRGYCIKCVIESHTKDTLPKTIKAGEDYLKETSKFYQKCRQRVHNAGEPLAEYTDELSKKGERLEMLSKHIDQEKQMVKKRFEDIRKSMLQVIRSKEEECLRLLEEEILSLSEAYTQYEKLLTTGWLKFSDIEVIYPTADALEQRMSKIVDMDQLQAFMRGVAEDIQIEKLYSDERDGLEKRKSQIDFLIKSFQEVESSLPKIQGKLLDSAGLEDLMKELLKEFSNQEIKVENSIRSRMKQLPDESEIIDFNQLEVLKSWLPDYKNFTLKLLYRGSVDGMSPQMFHNKCDEKGATVSLIKCQFNGAPSSSIIGGFIDQSWNSKNINLASDKAFIFSITSGTPVIKCSILESERAYAFNGHRDYGPIFGKGHDIIIQGNFKSGCITPSSYSNSSTIRYNNQRDFIVQEVEVFQVQ